MLERGQEISKREWKLIRVAIVAMENSTYIGRLFFGDKETGEVVWDCDCRPSDGMWLSFQVSTDITQQNASICIHLAYKSGRKGTESSASATNYSGMSAAALIQTIVM